MLRNILTERVFVRVLHNARMPGARLVRVDPRYGINAGETQLEQWTFNRNGSAALTFCLGIGFAQ
jgi:hypothetical protein